MIKIGLDDNEYCPQVFCDHCGERICKGMEGNYEWLVDDHGRPASGELFFTHKHCCLPFEDAHGGRHSWFSIGLECLPIFLGRNLELDWKKAKKTADMMGLIS